MIRSLIRKELRDQRPFLLLVVFLELLELGSEVITASFARMPLAYVVLSSYATTGLVFLIVIAFALGTGLLTREHEEGTLEFLDSLPIGRGRLFAVKIVTGWGVLMAGPLVEVLGFLLRHAWFRSSIDPQWHLGLLFTGVLLQGAVILVGLALGVLLSFVGRLSWMFAGMLALLVYVLVKQVPAASILDPTAIAVARFEGSSWRVPTSTLTFHLIASAVALAISFLLFTGTLDRPLRSLWAFLSGPAATPIAVVTGIVGAILIGLVSADSFGGGAGRDPDGDGLSFPEPAVGTFASRRYEFRFPVTLQQRAAPLFDRGDEIFAKVQAELGAPDPGAKISVDLTGSARHTAGLAFWNAIRMDLESADDADGLLAILAHETTHVLAGHLVTAQRRDRLDVMSTFNEGLARHVQRTLFPNAMDRDEGRAVAALLIARKQMKVEQVFDAGSLAESQDRDLVYPFGQLIVEALVKRYGKEAPKKVLQAAGRADAPEDLGVLGTWQDAFQTAGFDLSRVVFDVQKELKREHERHRKELVSLPRPKPAFKQRLGKRLVIDLHYEGQLPDGWLPVCRFRANATTPPTDYLGPLPASDDVCYQHANQIERDTLWVQVGVSAPGGYVIYEPWVSIPVD